MICISQWPTGGSEGPGHLPSHTAAEQNSDAPTLSLSLNLSLSLSQQRWAPSSPARGWGPLRSLPVSLLPGQRCGCAPEAPTPSPCRASFSSAFSRGTPPVAAHSPPSPHRPILPQTAHSGWHCPSPDTGYPSHPGSAAVSAPRSASPTWGCTHGSRGQQATVGSQVPSTDSELALRGEGRPSWSTWLPTAESSAREPCQPPFPAPTARHRGCILCLVLPSPWGWPGDRDGAEGQGGRSPGRPQLCPPRPGVSGSHQQPAHLLL